MLLLFNDSAFFSLSIWKGLQIVCFQLDILHTVPYIYVFKYQLFWWRLIYYPLNAGNFLNLRAVTEHDDWFGFDFNCWFGYELNFLLIYSVGLCLSLLKLLGNSAWINSNKEQGLHRHSLGFSLSLNLAIYLLYSVYSSLPLLLSRWQILSYILIRAFTHI